MIKRHSYQCLPIDTVYDHCASKTRAFQKTEKSRSYLSHERCEDSARNNRHVKLLDPRLVAWVFKTRSPFANIKERSNLQKCHARAKLIHFCQRDLLLVASLIRTASLHGAGDTVLRLTFLSEPAVEILLKRPPEDNNCPAGRVLVLFKFRT